MGKFRKKPVVISAFQWFEQMGEIGGVKRNFEREGMQPKGGSLKYWKIKTLEGWYEVTPGDWIITGIKGELYPCKPEIFEATYEEVNSGE
jgi:hypothetical protein